MLFRSVNPREVSQIKKALLAISDIKFSLQNTPNDALKRLSDGLNPCKILTEVIEKQLVEDAPLNLAKGNVIANGADKDLDELRHVIANAKELLLDIQTKESVRTGIVNLKIGFN